MFLDTVADAHLFCVLTSAPAGRVAQTPTDVTILLSYSTAPDGETGSQHKREEGIASGLELKMDKLAFIVGIGQRGLESDKENQRGPRKDGGSFPC